MSLSLTDSEKDLIDRVNYGVNLYVTKLPGLSLSRSPVKVLTERKGSTAEVALLKLTQLRKEGLPANRLAMGTCYLRKVSVALVRSEWRTWYGRKHPCWIVLDHDNLALRPVFNSIYSRNGLEMKSLSSLLLMLENL